MQWFGSCQCQFTCHAWMALIFEFQEFVPCYIKVDAYFTYIAQSCSVKCNWNEIHNFRSKQADFSFTCLCQEGLTTVGLAQNPKKQDIGNVYVCHFVTILNQDVANSETILVQTLLGFDGL